MKTHLAIFALMAAGIVLGDLGAASATEIVDAALTNVSQIRSQSNSPYFGALNTQNTAAVNLSYATPAGWPINGIGFHDLDINTAMTGSGVALTTGLPGVTLDYNFTSNVTHPGNRGLTNANIGGSDPFESAAANNLVTDNRYINATEHQPNILTFHGLTGNNPVYVQFIGGQHGWNGNTTLYVNGDGSTEGSGTAEAANWDSNKTSYTAGLWGIATTTKASGDLTLELQSNYYSGISAVIVQQQGTPVAEASLPSVGPDFDVTLTSAGQLVSTPFSAGNEVVAAVNYHNAGTTTSGTTAGGIAFDNLDVLSFTRMDESGIALTENRPGVTLDVDKDWAGSSRFQDADITGDGTLDAVLENLGGVFSGNPADNQYFFDMTFHGLGNDRRQPR